MLRLLRYIRLKHKYGMTDAESSYEEILKQKIGELKFLPKERIKQEFEKILTDKTNVPALKQLKSIGYLQIFLPHIDHLSLAPG